MQEHHRQTLLDELQQYVNGDDEKAKLARDVVEMVETGKNLDGKDLYKIAELLDTTIADLLNLPVRRLAPGAAIPCRLIHGRRKK